MAKKIPQTTGAVIDALYKLRNERIEKQRGFEEVIAKLKEAEKALEDHLISTLGKSKLNGAKGSLATVSVSKSVVPGKVNWTELYSYIVENDAFDLLEKRVAKVAFRDRLEQEPDGIPGVEPMEITTLSLNKAGK
jgi:hypothetical protein